MVVGMKCQRKMNSLAEMMLGRDHTGIRVQSRTNEEDVVPRLQDCQRQPGAT